MQTYAELLKSLANHPGDACQDFVTDGTPLSRTTGDVLFAAKRRGSELTRLGVRRGERVGIMVSDPAEFLPLVHGCLLYGLVAVPMYPPPLFGRVDRYGKTLAAILKTADVRLLVADPRLTRRLGALPVERIVELDALSDTQAAGGMESGGTRPSEVHSDELPEVTPEDLAFLQFTSGSSGEPKGVCITHRCLMANAHSIMVDGLGADETDRGVSWLPLYHDMGLIGFGLAPLLTNTRVTFIPTARFIKNPSIWLRTIDSYRASITFAPNFAYGLVTRRVEPDGLDLSSVRMWGCGAEPIAPATLEAFEHHFAPAGVESGAVAPCYGLAEATLAVTFTPPKTRRVVDNIDRDAWHERQVAQVAAEGAAVLRYVSCGRALPGQHVRVVDAQGRALPDRQAGEIVVEGASVGDGYYGAQPDSAGTFRADGLHTGDLGYLAEGHLYVTGRIKDVIIVGGRNYDPRQIEREAERVDGVRLAAAVNVATDQGDELVVVVERRGNEKLEAAIKINVATSLGVKVAHVVSLAPGSLPKTTSGKLKRREARALATRYLS